MLMTFILERLMALTPSIWAKAGAITLEQAPGWADQAVHTCKPGHVNLSIYQRACVLMEYM